MERFADGAIWTGWRNKRLARRVYTSRPICADCFSEAAHGTAKGEAVVAGFHILEGVTLPNGVVKTANGTFDYTQYTAMIDLGQKVYYFKTYENPQVIQVDMKPLWKSKEKVVQDLGSIQTSIFYGHLR